MPHNTLSPPLLWDYNRRVHSRRWNSRLAQHLFNSRPASYPFDPVGDDGVFAHVYLECLHHDVLPWQERQVGIRVLAAHEPGSVSVDAFVLLAQMIFKDRGDALDLGVVPLLRTLDLLRVEVREPYGLGFCTSVRFARRRRVQVQNEDVTLSNLPVRSTAPGH